MEESKLSLGNNKVIEIICNWGICSIQLPYPSSCFLLSSHIQQFDCVLEKTSICHFDIHFRTWSRFPLVSYLTHYPQQFTKENKTREETVLASRYSIKVLQVQVLYLTRWLSTILPSCGAISMKFELLDFISAMPCDLHVE